MAINRFQLKKVLDYEIAIRTNIYVTLPNLHMTVVSFRDKNYQALGSGIKIS